MIRKRSLLLCGVIAVMPTLAYASEKRVSAEVSTTVGYSNNPFSTAGNDTGSGFAQAEFRPQVQFVSERSTVTVSAAAQVQQYFKRYSTADSYQVGLDYRGRPSEHFTTHLSARAVSSILGSLNNFAGALVPPVGDGGSVVIPPSDPINSGTDIGLFGTRGRQRTINVGGDVTAALSERDQVTGAVFFNDSHYSRITTLGTVSNYYGFGGSLGYARQLSQFTQIGLQGSGARYVYQIPGANTNVYALQATLSAKLNAQWTLSGAAGASFVDRNGGGIRTAFSGNLSLCRAGPRASACLTALRAVLPTGILGTQTQTTVGASYRYRLSEHAALAFTGNYSKNGTPLAGLTNSNEFAQGTISYDRQLRKRLRLISSVHYRKLIGGILSRTSDFGGQVGLAVRLGDTR